MSKKAEANRHHPKKQAGEHQQTHLTLGGDHEQPASTRRRLKKLAEVNRDEEIVDHEDTERVSSEQQVLEGEQEYRQFGLKDDEDLKKEQQIINSKKQTKSFKKNQQLDNFLNKCIPPNKKTSKEAKPKASNLQLTLEEMSLIKKQKRAYRKSSEEFSFSDQEPPSPQPQKLQPESAARKRYQQFNGSTEDQKKLVEYAMKLSLTAASDKRSTKVEDNIDEEKYPIKEVQINKKLMLSQQKKNAKEKKPAQEKNKQKKNTQREGPLSGLVIAFTGEFADYEKDEVIEVCMQLGAECPKSITKKCNLLIQGAFVLDHFKRKLSTPVTETSKSREARERNIKIIAHDQLQDFFFEKTESSLQQLIDRNKVGIKDLLSSDMRGTQIPLDQDKRLQKQDQKSKIVSQKMQVEIVKKLPALLRQDTRLWTEKYKPNKLEDVRGHNSQIKQLKQWLQTWDDVHIRGLNPDLKELKGQSPKAALLSGDPGIGKTTTARLLAVELNYAVSQFNASDVRNKSGINLMQSKSYSLDISKNLQKSLIIMDEVDGMSAGDRGGVAAIIQMIKSAKVPIICICNDRSSQKIRSLASHCLDVRFHKPQKGVLVKRLKEVLENEGGSGEDRALQLLVETFNNDMRQILSYLELIFKTVSPKITLSALGNRSSHSKDSAVMINHFDATRRLLNRSEFGGLSISQRTDLFFIDSDLVPIMVHENLLASSRKPKMNTIQFHSFVKGLEGVIIGDMLDRMIRREQEWGLMPSYGFMSCVYSTEKISDSLGFPQFSSWLGKNSSERKNRRLGRQLKNSIFPTTLCSSFSVIKNHYSSLLLQQIISLLKQEDVERAIEFMQEYGLNPGLLNQHLNSLVMSTDKSSPLSAIPSQIKSKLTRLFNKRHEDAKLKEQKSKKGAAQHAKFNPVLQQMEMEDQGEGEVEEEDAKEEKRKVESKKGKKK